MKVKCPAYVCKFRDDNGYCTKDEIELYFPYDDTNEELDVLDCSQFSLDKNKLKTDFSIKELIDIMETDN